MVTVVHAVIRREGRFLVGKRSLAKECSPGTWAFLGGRVEPDESLHQALLRECAEEADLLVKAGRHLFEVKEEFAIHHWILVEQAEGEPRNLDGENSELRWVSLEEFRK